MPHISVVIPTYKSEGTVVELAQRLKKSLGKITADFEVIFVEDRGGDRSWEQIVALAGEDNRIKGIQFCRNFGQHYALTAGLDHAQGEWVVTMDCDLQDQPEEIGALYEKALAGYDVVLARRLNREDSGDNTFASKIFYKIFDYFTDTKTDPAVGTFRIMSHKVVENFVSMRERQRFYAGIIQWMGFRTASIDVQRSERPSGQSTYNFRKRLALATTAIISFSNKPLILSIKLGFMISVLSVIYAGLLIYRKFAHDIQVEGWTSVIVSLYLLGGLIIMNMGIIGIYLGKIFDQTKGRPLYIIDQKTFNS